MDFDYPIIGGSIVRIPRTNNDDMIKWDRRFLQLSEVISTWSKDPSTKIGSVIIDPKTKRILSTGYNGFPRNIEDRYDRLENREQKYKFVVHAEMNAIYNATWNGVSLDGATIYTTGLPTCSDCAKGVIQVGIKRVVCGYPENIADNWIEHYEFSKSMFTEAGIIVTNYHDWT